MLRNLYVFGATNVDGPGELLLDGDLALSDGVAYWINVGVTAKGGTASTWTGRWSGNLRTTANARVERCINLHRAEDATITGARIDLRDLAAGTVTYPGGGIAGYNNGAWCANPYRARIWVTQNTLLANQSSALGSEGIGFGAMSGLWVLDNHVHGFGDDPIGLHNVSDGEVAGNRCWSRDGRIFASGAVRVKIHDNYNERIANPDGTWTSGGGLLEISTESSTHPGPLDVDVHNNTLVHGSGITSATYGIRLRGPRRVRVHHNKIHDTTGFGYGVTWEGQSLTGWVDGAGIEADANIRIRDLEVYDNTVTGAGADGRISEVLAFADHAPGPIFLGHNVPGAGGSLTYTPAAYQAASNPRRGVTSGHYFLPVSPGGAGTFASLGNNSLRLAPFVVEKTITIDRLFVDVTAAGNAGALFRLGVYTDDGTGRPGTLLVDGGTVVADTTGVKEVIISTVLRPGVYWIGGAVQGAGTTQPTIRIPSGWNPPINLPLGTALPGAATTAIGWLHSGSVSAALPATFTPSVAVGQVARIGCRAA